ncbi:MAG TPA: oxidoreductase [Casimicrobiaceae bacterium]|jgi:NAD(P)-dependent dehydrogenase (short-subunit alcohol dehydrogenase family)|nr:oxidoreductase [Casimicrobiaceae bacterium]
MQNWLITGCSTGLGRAIAKAVLDRGWNAAVTARDVTAIEPIVSAQPSRALALELDVTNPNQVADVSRRALEHFGSIDVLVNNAGYGYRAAVEEADEGDVDELFATNFFGLVAMTKALLPSMRARKQGAIVNISSTAGRMAQPGSGYYSASKFAVEGLSESLRKEVGPLGIKVLVVEPGPFRTDFAGRSLKQSIVTISDYSLTAGPRRKENDKASGRQPGDPVRGAEAIITAVLASNSPRRLVLGRDAVKRMRNELEKQLEELNDWASMSESTDFPT